MFVPGRNHVIMAGFDYGANDGHMNAQNGQIPVKLLNFVDKSSGLIISYTFTAQEWAQFKNVIFAKEIIPATDIPRIIQG